MADQYGHPDQRGRYVPAEDGHLTYEVQFDMSKLSLVALISRSSRKSSLVLSSSAVRAVMVSSRSSDGCRRLIGMSQRSAAASRQQDGVPVATLRADEPVRPASFQQRAGAAFLVGKPRLEFKKGELLAHDGPRYLGQAAPSRRFRDIPISLSKIPAGGAIQVEGRTQSPFRPLYDNSGQPNAKEDSNGR